MNYIERILDGVHSVFNVNEATLSGAVDVIAVRQSDGSLKSTPFHVRFGKFKLFSYRENLIYLIVNGEETDVKMKLGSGGVAFFVIETKGPVTPFLATSPIQERAWVSSDEEYFDYDTDIVDIQNFEARLEENGNITNDFYQEFEYQQPNITVSKCGPGFFEIGSVLVQRDLFDRHVLDFDSLMDQFEYHEIIPMLENNMVFKIDDKFYNWSTAGPLLISKLLFNRLPPSHIVKKLEHETKSMSSSTQSPPKGAPLKGKRSSWFFWRKEEKEKPQAYSESSNSSSEGEDILHDSSTDESAFCLTLVPTSEQLERMNLKEGKNVITFSVRSARQGRQEITTNLYLWDKNAKVVISDIDGTITKSDLFGHILPVLGKDWSHSGVAELYTNIRDNGYQILYLTARAIGQSGVTKDYLKSLSQSSNGIEEGITLPDGPVFMSPDRVLSALNREVILRKPEVFKIDSLGKLSEIFEGRNPFYAGFGNKHSDAKAYSMVGVPEEHTFIINPFSEISCMNGSYSKTYESLNELVDEMFPSEKVSETPNEFYDYQYWKPQRKMNLEELEKSLKRKSNN